MGLSIHGGLVLAKLAAVREKVSHMAFEDRGTATAELLDLTMDALRDAMESEGSLGGEFDDGLERFADGHGWTL